MHYYRFIATMHCWKQSAHPWWSWRKASRGWSWCPLTSRRSSIASTMPRFPRCGARRFPRSSLWGRGPGTLSREWSSSPRGPRPPTPQCCSGSLGSPFQRGSSQQCCRQQLGKIMYVHELHVCYNNIHFTKILILSLRYRKFTILLMLDGL